MKNTVSHQFTLITRQKHFFSTCKWIVDSADIKDSTYFYLILISKLINKECLESDWGKVEVNMGCSECRELGRGTPACSMREHDSVVNSTAIEHISNWRHVLWRTPSASLPATVYSRLQASLDFDVATMTKYSFTQHVYRPNSLFHHNMVAW